MKRSQAQAAARIAAIALLSVIIAGCQSQVGMESRTGTHQTQTGQAGVNADFPGSPQQAFNKNPNEGGEIPVENADAENGKSEVEGAKMDSASGKTAQTSGNKTTSGWNPKSPKLHGIGVGISEQSALKKLGAPIDSYSYGEGSGKISVQEFEGFSVGTGAGGKVMFVEVFDKKADAKLNGLQIGGSAEAAAKALGKPYTHTGSVISYKVDDAMLKIDLDPKTETIVSFKLFSLK